MSIIQELRNKLVELEGRVADLTNTTSSVVTSSFKKNFKLVQQSSRVDTLSIAICVDTIDTIKQNRVRYYSPLISDPQTPLLGLPWAHPISPFGGFDDSGVNWVPPAGSTVALLFLGGDRDAAFYIGTTWHRKRDSDFGVPVKEFDNWYAGHRGGYLLGDQNQVLPPWNNESYNGANQDDISSFLSDSEDQKNVTYPNIYGFKTPEKHMLKMVDGNVRCQRRHKRFELLSGCGNWFIMKDDHLHYAGQYAHTSCGPTPGGPSIATCIQTNDEFPFLTDPEGSRIRAIEGGGTKSGDTLQCQGKTSHSSILGGHPSHVQRPNSNQGTNPFFKHANECRPYSGPGTPQNNKADLPQSGVQILSIGGHTIVLDDSVEEPRGFPKWDDPYHGATAPFDFGCNDKTMSRMYLKSQTGHAIYLSDVERESNVRGNQNYIRALSAAGNSITLNDDTVGNIAGPERGVLIQSTSNHIIRLCDETNKQKSPDRAEGGAPVPRANKAYILIRSGYGLLMKFSDDFDQVTTQRQKITIMNPQCHCSDEGDTPCLDDLDVACNKKHGPHIFEMLAAPNPNPGQVLLRVGGNYIIVTTENMITQVGDKERNPSNKITVVSKNYINETEKLYYNHADKHIFFAEDKIFLLAGRDCPPDPESEEACKECQPCVFPIIIARCPVVCPFTGIVHWSVQSVSERVFASGFHECKAGCGGCGGYEEAMQACVKERGGCDPNEIGEQGTGEFGDADDNQEDNL